MSNLHVLGSSSHGNGYILDCGTDKLIIECGVSAQEPLKFLRYNLQGCHNVIVSHSDSDHFGYARVYMRYFNVYSTRMAANIIPGVTPLRPEYKYQFGKINVTPLEVEHSVPCFAYVIEYGEERILFATDLKDFPYNIKDLTAILIECNYSEGLREQAILNGAEVRSNSYNHLEINDTIRILKRLKNPKLNKVVLLHLSDDFSDEEAFKKKILHETGINADVADKGLTFDLSNVFA